MNNKYLFPTIFFARTRFLFFTLCALCALCGITPAQDFKTVHDGVEYAQVVHKLGSDPVKINLLRLDLRKVRLDVHHAMDAAIGTEKTSSIATRQGAVAAINAGFFRLDKSKYAGDAVGILMIDGKLLSESLNDRIALLIGNGKKETSTGQHHIKTSTFVRLGQSNSDQVIEISGINREAKTGETILFDHSFGTVLSESTGFVFEIEFGDCKRSKNIWDVGTFICRKVLTKLEQGDRIVPRDSFVISFNASSAAELRLINEKVARFSSLPKDKQKVIISSSLRDGSLHFVTDHAIDIVSGVPQLLKDGKISITWEQEKSSKAFVETRHPRTAVAKLKDGKFLMITVDGRQPGASVGMNLNELAAYLLELGAVDAMNLDGGGSTTMFLDGKVVNQPSDKEGERKVSDAILVTLRKNRPGKLE